MDEKEPNELTSLEATLIYEDCEVAVAELRKDNGLAPLVAESYLLMYCAHKLADQVDDEQGKALMRLAIANSIINPKMTRRKP